MAKAQILVIDDDPVILDMLQLALEKADYEVLSAIDGDLGLDLFRREKPDLVVVDIAMPGIDGYQVIEQIRGTGEEATKTPIIILTAHQQSVMRAYAEELGVDLYLTKPVAPQKLIGHISELVK
jgi:DNA-binding response OmpR family regulator